MSESISDIPWTSWGCQECPVNVRFQPNLYDVRWHPLDILVTSVNAIFWNAILTSLGCPPDIQTDVMIWHPGNRKKCSQNLVNKTSKTDIILSKTWRPGYVGLLAGNACDRWQITLCWKSMVQPDGTVNLQEWHVRIDMGHYMVLCIDGRSTAEPHNAGNLWKSYMALKNDRRVKWQS